MPDKIRTQESIQEDDKTNTTPEPAQGSPISPFLYWSLIICLSILLFGSNYSYDLPASVKVSLEKRLGSTSELFDYQIQVLNSLYSVLNIFSPIIFGIILDVDFKRSHYYLLAVNVIAILGQTIVTLGVSFSSFELMAVGRTIYGVGAETVGVIQTRFIVLVTLGLDMSTSLAICSSMGNVGYIANEFLSPTIANTFGVDAAFWASVGTCLISFLASIPIFIWVRNRNRSTYQVLDESPRSMLSPLTPISPLSDSHPNQRPHSAIIPSNKALKFYARRRFSLRTVNRSSMSTIFSNGSTNSIISAINEPPNAWNFLKNTAKATMKTVRTLSYRFWLVLMILILTDSPAGPFSAIETELVGDRFFEGDYVKARFYMGMSYILSVILTPLLGYMQDRFGMMPLSLFVSGIFGVAFLILLFYSTWHPMIAFTVLAIANMSLPISWAAITKLIPEEQFAFAIGFAVTILNVALTVVPIIVGGFSYLYPLTTIPFFKQSFFYEVHFLIALYFIACILSLWLWWDDHYYHDDLLSKPMNESGGFQRVAIE